MLPSLSLNQSRYLPLRYRKHSCERLLIKGTACVQPAYFKNLSLCHFRTWVGLSTHAVHAIKPSIRNVFSPFFNAILRVIKWGSNEEMERVATRRIVAVVAHIHSIRDFAVDKFVGNPVCKFKLPISLCVAVATFCFIARPVPAFVELSDLNIPPKESLVNSVPVFDFLNKASEPWYIGVHVVFNTTLSSTCKEQ